MNLKYSTIFSNRVIFVFLILLSSFGPYVFPSFGVRSEHIVIYFCLVFFLLSNSIRIKKNTNIFILLSVLLLFIITPIVGGVFLDRAISKVLIVSQFENYIQPLSIILLCISILGSYCYNEIKEYFHFILKVFVILMSVHTVFIIVVQEFQAFEFLRMFTGSRLVTGYAYSTVGVNAAEVAAMGGRYSGVFTQVFEAGYAYSIALISYGYLLNNNYHLIKYKKVTLSLLLIGGLVTYSKVFLILGVFFFILITKKALLWRYLLYIVPIFLITDLLFSIEIFSKGIVYLERLVFIGENHSIFDIYTSGRFSEDSIIWINMQDVILNSPVFGFGYGSIQTSDFSLNEVITLGGLIGILTYLLLFLVLIFINAKIKDRTIQQYYIYILVITILASMSAPVITANRISVVFWIFTSFIVMLQVMQLKSNQEQPSKQGV